MSQLNGHKWLVILVGMGWSTLFALAAYTLLGVSRLNVDMAVIQGTLWTESEHYQFETTLSRRLSGIEARLGNIESKLDESIK